MNKILPNVLILSALGVVFVLGLACLDYWAVANIPDYESLGDHIIQLAALLLGGIVGSLNSLVPDKKKED